MEKEGRNTQQKNPLEVSDKNPDITRSGTLFHILFSHSSSTTLIKQGMAPNRFFCVHWTTRENTHWSAQSAFEFTSQYDRNDAGLVRRSTWNVRKLYNNRLVRQLRVRLSEGGGRQGGKKISFLYKIGFLALLYNQI